MRTATMFDHRGSHSTAAIEEQVGATPLAPQTSTPLKSSDNPLCFLSSPIDGTIAGGVLSSPLHAKSNQLHAATPEERTPLSPAGARNQGNVTTSSGPICRICHEGDQEKPLLSLCLCSGTVGLVHLSCLEYWLCASGSEHCEICQHRFNVERRRSGFCEWLRGSSRGARRSLLGDMICFLLLTPLAFVCGALCLHGATLQIVNHRFWEGVGLTTLSFLLFTVYFLWCLLTGYYHYKNWKKWQRANYHVRVLQDHDVEAPALTEEAGVQVFLEPAVPAMLLGAWPVVSLTDFPAAHWTASTLSPHRSLTCNSPNSVTLVSTQWEYRTSRM